MTNDISIREPIATPSEIANDISTRVPIIIPSYEPDDNLIELCKNLIDANLRNIVIVDDGSGPAYSHYFDEAGEMGCVILRNAVNLGKGRALKNAFNHILNTVPDVIGCVTADSDGQHLVKDIRNCINELIAHPQALILGCRDFSLDGVPKKSRFGNNLTRHVCSFLGGVKVSDTQTGLRGISADFMKSLLAVSGERFEFETRMLLVCKDKIEIREITIETVYDSATDHKTHFNPFKDSVRIYRIFGAAFLKYIFSALSSCAIDLVLFALLCWLLNPVMTNLLQPMLAPELISSLCIVIATAVARIISSIYNCIINYKLVFHSDKGMRSAGKYAALVIVQMLVSGALTALGSFLLPMIPDVAIKLVVDILLFFCSYYVQRKFIF